jgi:hypothetical protein
MNWTTRFFVASLLMLAATIGYGAVRVFGANYQNLAANALNAPQFMLFNGVGVSAFDMQSGGVPTANPPRSSSDSEEHESTTNTIMSMAPVNSATPTPFKDDDQGRDTDVRGTVNAVNGNTITVNGQTYTLSNNSEVKGSFQVGSNVKLEYHMNSDGTMTIEELKVVNSNMNDNSPSRKHSSDGDSNYNNNNSSSTCHGDDCDADSGGDD